RAAHSPGVEAALIKLVSDPDASVRQQVAYSLGSWDSPATARALGEAFRRDGKDPYIAAAVISSINRKNIAAVLEKALVPAADLPASVTDNLFRTTLGLGERQSLGLL